MLEFRHKLLLWHIVKSYTRNTKYIIVQAAFPAFYGAWRFITTFINSPPPVPPLAKSIHSSAHHTFDRRSLFPLLVGLRTYQHPSNYY